MKKTLKNKSLALVDFIRLNLFFMLQNTCPPMLNNEVGGKQPINYCVRYGYKPSYWRTYRVESGLKLFSN